MLDDLGYHLVVNKLLVVAEQTDHETPQLRVLCPLGLYVGPQLHELLLQLLSASLQLETVMFVFPQSFAILALNLPEVPAVALRSSLESGALGPEQVAVANKPNVAQTLEEGGHGGLRKWRSYETAADRCRT